MITVFHGDDTERSRTAYHLLVSQAAKGKDVRRLEGREVDASVLTQALESSSLFGGDVLVVIDNLFTKVGKKQKLASQYADILRQRPEGTEVIVWEGKELGATIQKALGSKARFEIFKTPVVIFQFLDSLAMGNAATLLGLYEPERGSVAIGVIPVDGIKKYGSESLNSKFGYANQNPGFIETMTLKDNLLLWNKEKIPEERVITVMRDLGMEKLIPRLEEKGKYFSGGELRLLGIARALLTNPKVLFLDEPTANLDPATVDRLVTVLQAIRKKFPGTTIITVTHDDDFAKHTDRTIHLSELNKRVPQQLGDHQVLEAVAKAR